MPLKVVGAGLGRTGTLSLKIALEKLLGAPCYHMAEVFTHPQHVPLWTAAARGEPIEWTALMDGYAAAVDWPACSFWRELCAANPDAIVLLSTRDAASWWQSASTTIFPAARGVPEGEPWREMWEAMCASRFTTRLDDERACIAAFEQHYAKVRAAVPRARLVEWSAADGWAPLCRALGKPAPGEPFPRVNTREEFLRAH